jgi:hypothetical protein
LPSQRIQFYLCVLDSSDFVEPLGKYPEINKLTNFILYYFQSSFIFRRE